jgi:ligand-binding sensor domain-containing protein
MKWTTYTTSDGLASNMVYAITIDSQGNKWFGTKGGKFTPGTGISKFDGTNWTTYTTEDGLADNWVTSIAIDAQNNIWFGTDGGVSKLSFKPTGINPVIQKNSLQIYPNPVQNILQVDLSGKTGLLEIHDISGKSVLQKQIIDNNTSIDVSGLDNGIYIIKVLSDNQIFTSKIVKY